MPERMFHFGTTFTVITEADAMADMELAQAVLAFLKQRLAPTTASRFRIVAESIHPIMVGPAGGSPVE